MKCPTESKSRIVDALINLEAPEHVSSQREEVKVSKKKPKIAQGVHYQDLFSWYMFADLEEYCRENNLKVSGTKPQLIRRILAFLDGDKENTLAKPKKNQSAETVQEKKPKSVQKAKEPEEEEKEASEEEEEEEEEEESEEEELGKPVPKEEVQEKVDPKKKGKKEPQPEPEEAKVEEPEKSKKKGKKEAPQPEEAKVETKVEEPAQKEEVPEKPKKNAKKEKSSK